MCDARGTPLAAVLTAGQCHECKSVEALVDGVRIGRRRRPAHGVGDKGYSYGFVRALLRRRHVVPVIPTRADQDEDPGFDEAAYRGRNVIERLVGWLKERRRLCTRFEKLAGSYLAMVKLAFIERCLQMARE